MNEPSVRFQLPDGRQVDAGPDAIVGRSPVAAVRIADPRISTVHAELSWRPEGPCLLARGGRLLVEGRATMTAALRPGLVVQLVPGLSLEVVAVTGGEVPVVPTTIGRERLLWQVGPAEVIAQLEGDPESAVRLTGVSARLAATLLAAGGALPWEDVASVLWPEDGVLRAERDRWTEVDERRYRNRWDQAVRVLRQQLAHLRAETLIESGGGTIALRRLARDTVEQAAFLSDPGQGPSP